MENELGELLQLTKVQLDLALDRETNLERLFQLLMNKVNLVTSNWRHTEQGPADAHLQALSERQVYIEQALEAHFRAKGET